MLIKTLLETHKPIKTLLKFYNNIINGFREKPIKILFNFH